MYKFLFLLILFAGCDIQEEIESDSSGLFGMLDKDTANYTVIVFNDSLNFNNTIQCPDNQYWNKFQNKCVCAQGYMMENDVCISRDFKECVFDKDCSPDGVLSKCDDDYVKRVYYCHNFRCVGGKDIGTVIDCPKEYGHSSRCVNGLCS